MKSRPLGAGQSILASQNNDKRDDARGGGFLLAHQQLGALALGTVPTNGQVVPIVINGTTITVTAVTAIGSTANNVLIGGSALAFVTNLVNFLRRPDLTTSTQIAASSANQTLLSYVGWAWPGSSTNVVPFSLNKNVNGITDILTSFNITGITVTSGTWTAQTMQLYVQDGAYYVNGTRYLFTGGSTPTVTAPSSHPRIDVLTIDTSGTLAWTTGSENVSPTAPAYPANKLAICELYNVVGETGLYDNENQQSGQAYIYNDVRPSVTAGPNLGAIPDDLLPDATNTRSLGSSGDQWLNIYGENVYVNGNPAAGAKFGGSGADGALSITSGTTTVNLAGAATYVKNYTSISITGTGALAFSNPATNGTTIILKSQGGVTLTSSATALISVAGIGAAGGSAGTASGSGNGTGGGGAGGGSIKNAGANGTNSSGNAATGTAPGGAGSSAIGFYTITGGSGGPNAAANNTGTVAGGSSPLVNPDVMAVYAKLIPLCPGSGGGGGGGNGNSGGTCGAGGNGGGALYIECVGAWNFTGAITAAGNNGTAASSGSNGAGAGGGGGMVIALYNTLTANSGTITVSGGLGGTTGSGQVAGANGVYYVGKNTEFS